MKVRSHLAKKRPEIFFGTFAEVYGDLDAEDCAMLDREWARWRGYILPSNGTSTLSRPAGEKPSLPVKNDHADELANRLASMPAAEAIRGPMDWATIMSSLRAQPKTSAALNSAALKALNYIENTESELGIKLSCGDALREALK
jgi:hypothetical protein